MSSFCARSANVARWPARSFTATTALSTRPRTTRSSAPTWASPGLWAPLAAAPTTSSPSRSTPHSNARLCKAPPGGTPPATRAGRLPVDHPLQHPPSALRLRPPQPHHLREHHVGRYATIGRVTIKSRVHDPGRSPHHESCLHWKADLHTGRPAIATKHSSPIRSGFAHS
jgi:hypothetical protein